MMIAGDREDLNFAIQATVETMLDEGKRLPLPTSELLRREQVNIRLTPEKKFLTEASTRRGFRGLSEFIRTIVLRACNASL